MTKPVTKKQGAQAYQLLQRQARQSINYSRRLPTPPAPPYEQFVDNEAKKAAHFFDGKDGAR